LRFLYDGSLAEGARMDALIAAALVGRRPPENED
jgi:ribosome-binding factor A